MYPDFLCPITPPFPVISTHLFSQRRHLSKPTSIAVGLITILLSLTVLGMGGVGWIPLTPVRPPHS